MGAKIWEMYVHHGHRRARRHAEQRQHRRTARRGQQHHRRHHHGIDDQNHRRIDRVVEIRLFHGAIARLDGLVVAPLHVFFLAQRVNGANIAQRFGHIAGGAAHRAAMLQLRRQHALLHPAREAEQERQQRRQNQRKAPVLEPDHRQNADDAARVGEHADDAAGEQVLHRVHVAHEPGDQRARLLPVQRIGAQSGELRHQPAAQRVGDLLVRTRSARSRAGIPSRPPAPAAQNSSAPWRRKRSAPP